MEDKERIAKAIASYNWTIDMLISCVRQCRIDDNEVANVRTLSRLMPKIMIACADVAKEARHVDDLIELSKQPGPWLQLQVYATITSAKYCYKVNEGGDVIAYAEAGKLSTWHRCDDAKLMESIWLKFKGGLIKGEVNTHTNHSVNQWVAYYGDGNDCSQCFFSLSRSIEFLGEVDSPTSLLQPGFSVLVCENI
jgi:hypothetical protein